MIMLKRMICALTIAVATATAAAAGYDGVFEGIETGMVSVSGKSYPLKPDVMAQYEGRLVAVDTLPVGTPVRFELGQFAGVSSIVELEVTQASDTLDEMFPDH
jgi:hypothetical protein